MNSYRIGCPKVKTFWTPFSYLIIITYEVLTPAITQHRKYAIASSEKLTPQNVFSGGTFNLLKSMLNQ